MATVKDTFFTGKITVTADTLLNVLVPARRGLFPVLSDLWYTAQGTAHVLTIMRPQGRTTLSAAAEASQAVINLTADPGSIAANDWIAIECDDGTTVLHQVDSVDVLEVTLTGNLDAAKRSGNTVWFFGLAADTENAKRNLAAPDAATTKWQNVLAGFGSAGVGEPMLLQSDNATDAGTFAAVSAAYCQGGARN